MALLYEIPRTDKPMEIKHGLTVASVGGRMRYGVDSE